MANAGQQALTGRLDSKIKLDVALFFAENPDAMDSAASIGTWAGYHMAEMEQALEELCADGLLTCHGQTYRLTDDQSLRAELRHFAAHYRQARRGVEDVIAGLERERRRMAERIEELEVSMRAIVGGMGDALIVVGSDLSVKFANSAAQALLGEAIGEVGRPLQDTGAPPELVEAFKDSADRAERVRASLVSSSHAGTRYYQADVSPILRHGGELYGLVGVLADVTELRRLDNLKSELIRFVSHELRNPLTALKSCADTLVIASEHLDHDRQQKFSQVISREVDRLARLVDGFLDISKIEAGRALDLHGRVFDAVQLAREAIELQRTASDRCTLSLLPTEEPIEVQADRDKTLQVLLNLLSNAQKYSPGGGEITVAVTRLNGDVHFSVCDQGVGIQPGELDQIFTPFYRADEATTRTVRGTGLGLYLSRKLVEAHGGRMWVESEPGRGSTFHFVLPSRPPVEEDAPNA